MGVLLVAGSVRRLASGRLEEHEPTVEVGALQLTTDGVWRLECKCGCRVHSGGWLPCWEHRARPVVHLQLFLPFPNESEAV